MAREEENTKAATDNSGSNPIEAYDREINRLSELKWKLNNEFLNQPNKEFLALDLWKFLEGYPQVKANIGHYIRNCLEQLWISIDDRVLCKQYFKRIMELEQQLKEKENDTELH